MTEDSMEMMWKLELQVSMGRGEKARDETWSETGALSS